MGFITQLQGNFDNEIFFKTLRSVCPLVAAPFFFFYFLLPCTCSDHSFSGVFLVAELMSISEKFSVENSMDRRIQRSIDHEVIKSWTQLSDFHSITQPLGGFPGSSVVKNSPTKQEMWVRSLDQKDPLVKKMLTHSSILAWKIP